MALTNEAMKVFAKIETYDKQLKEAQKLVKILKAVDAKHSDIPGEQTVLDFAEAKFKKINKERADYKIAHGITPCGH